MVNRSFLMKLLTFTNFQNFLEIYHSNTQNNVADMDTAVVEQLPDFGRGVTGRQSGQAAPQI